MLSSSHVYHDSVVIVHGMVHMVYVVEVNMETKSYFDLVEENERLKKEVESLKTIELEGWKGKDDVRYERVGYDWEVIEHRKDKETGEIATNKRSIPHKNVQVLWSLIKLQCEQVGQKTKYRKIVPSLIEHYHLPVGIEEFNGGKNRSRYYFPLYQYPVRILEHLKVIKYGGRGTIIRIKGNGD